MGLVTAPLDRQPDLERELTELLRESGLSEFKWTDLRGAKERFAAEKMCRFALEHAAAGDLRVDVLIWDIEDRRHHVRGRDDVAKLQRMYYHLFRNVLRARWPNDAIWRLHPDEQTAMDWETVRDCLDAVAVRIDKGPQLTTSGGFRVRLRKEFGIEEIQPVRSEGEPLLQLADLFAGIGAFSHREFQSYQGWLEATSPQGKLEGFVREPRPASGASKERFAVLRDFDRKCKDGRMGVSVQSRAGLWTPDPGRPLNFWLYEPQHPDDVAPTRSAR